MTQLNPVPNETAQRQAWFERDRQPNHAKYRATPVNTAAPAKAMPAITSQIPIVLKAIIIAKAARDNPICEAQRLIFT